MKLEDLIAHFLAVLVVVGFFGLAFLVLGDFVDLTDSTMLALAGTILGYMSGKADRVLARYFKDKINGE